MVHNIALDCQHVWPAGSQTSEIVSLDTAPTCVTVDPYLLDMVGIKQCIVGVGWPVPAELIVGSGGQSGGHTRGSSSTAMVSLLTRVGSILTMLE